MNTTKHPESIESVTFADNTLAIKLRCCTEQYDISTGKSTHSNAAGRMSVELSSPVNKVIRVKTVCLRDTARPRPQTLISLPPSSNNTVDQTEDELIFKTGTFEVHVSKTGSFRMRFFYCGTQILSQPDLGTFYRTDDASAVIGTRLEISPDERIYGLGPCGSSVLRNGSRVDKAIPVFFSSQNYGLFVNTVKPVSFDIGSRDSNASFEVTGNELEYYIFAGDSIQDLLTQYTQIYGAMHIPSVLTQGVALKFNGNFAITSDFLITTVRKYKNLGLSVSEVWLGNSWHPENDMCGFTWDAERFPNPDALLRALHDSGTKLGLSVTPVVSDSSPDYTELLDNNYLVSDANGKALIIDNPCGNLAIINMVILTARNWFTNKCDVLLKSQCDYLEQETPPFVLDILEEKVADKAFQLQFSSSINIALCECEIRARGRGGVVAITSDNRAGDHIVPYANVRGENDCSFASLSSILRKSLSLGMSGYPAVNIDIPKKSMCTEALFDRRTQLSLFAPHFRFNVSREESDPDNPRSIFNSIKSIEEMRYGLMPYIYSSIIEGSLYGIPAMRLLAAEFPNDVFARGNESEYMFGNSLLVSPVLNENGTVRTYIPLGVWTDLITHERVQGPRYVTHTVPAGTLPIYVRPGAIITTRTPNSNNFRFFLDNITFTCFELADGMTTACEVYEDGAVTSGVVSINRSGAKITVTTKGFGENKRVILAGITNVVSTSESVPEKSEFGTMIEFSSNELIVTLG